MPEQWPTDVRAAIEWHHEAEVAAVRAKRALEGAEANAAVDVRSLRDGLGHRSPEDYVKLQVMEATKETRAAFDLAELEEAKRHKWLCYLIGKEGRER